MSSHTVDTGPRASGGALTGASLLPAVLALDAVVTGVNAVAYLAAAGPLGDLVGLSSTLLRATGAFLLAFAVAVGAVAAWGTGSRPAVLAVVTGNAAWAIASVVTALAGWGSPDAVGTAWIAAQAIVVGAFAELQLVGLRRRGR